MIKTFKMDGLEVETLTLLGFCFSAGERGAVLSIGIETNVPFNAWGWLILESCLINFGNVSGTSVLMVEKNTQQ